MSALLPRPRAPVAARSVAALVLLSSFARRLSVLYSFIATVSAAFLSHFTSIGTGNSSRFRHLDSVVNSLMVAQGCRSLAHAWSARSAGADRRLPANLSFRRLVLLPLIFRASSPTFHVEFAVSLGFARQPYARFFRPTAALISVATTELSQGLQKWTEVRKRLAHLGATLAYLWLVRFQPQASLSPQPVDLYTLLDVNRRHFLSDRQ